MNNTATCPFCKRHFEITEAFRAQIEDELVKARSGQEEILRKELDSEARKKIELETMKLRSLLENAKESEKGFREQLKSLMEELSRANKAGEDAELTARRELLSKEKLIREEAAKKASEDFYLKIREHEETISKLREQLTTAKQVAEQGSQQLQGEILEIDVINNLRGNFPLDTIDEVKKGERGSDIRHIVNERTFQNCGLVLWECKNAKTYQASWLSKLKDEMATERAQIGVIVFSPVDGGGEALKRLDDNIWLVKPRFAVTLATFLREILVRVHRANKNAEGKDVKIEMIYNYLTGGEFNNRVRYIIESYNEMQGMLDAEKKQAMRRWAQQEKILEKVNGGLYGLSGDLQGIAGREVIDLPGLLEVGEE